MKDVRGAFRAGEKVSARMSENFATVGELVEYLKQFDPSRPLIVDDDGDTWGVGRDMIQPWSDDPNDPIAIFVGLGELELTVDKTVSTCP